METETVSGEEGEEWVQGVYAYTDYDGRWGSEAVTQEAAPFFAGQKTAGEVADIIQSRLQMYVNENL